MLLCSKRVNKTLGRVFGTVKVHATPNTPTFTRQRTLDDLTDKEKIREAFNIRATNILLQGLPPDVYTFVNHHTVAKEIWDRVKLLIEEDMHESSFDPLYAYLRRHEVHANEVHRMRQRFPDPLALVANTYNT
ncbi:hypothetical protein Tco_0102159, partial [Tanacetum coccineum]